MFRANLSKFFFFFYKTKAAFFELFQQVLEGFNKLKKSFIHFQTSFTQNFTSLKVLVCFNDFFSSCLEDSKQVSNKSFKTQCEFPQSFMQVSQKLREISSFIKNTTMFNKCPYKYYKIHRNFKQEFKKI